MTRDEIKAEVAKDGVPRCLNCGDKMRYNVPRLGESGGYVHADTCQFGCGDKPRFQAIIVPTPTEAD